MKPTREEILIYLMDVINGEKENPLDQGLVYKNLRESHGKNRSPEIDRLIKRQGGALGESWCQYLQQDLLDVIRNKFNCKINLPEGGSTQSFWEATSKKYKHQLARPLSIAIWRKGDSWLGHAALCLSKFDEYNEFKTFEGNTQSDTQDLVRNGDGAYFRTRKSSYSTMQLRGFIDIYEAITFNDTTKEFLT